MRPRRFREAATRQQVTRGRWRTGRPPPISTCGHLLGPVRSRSPQRATQWAADPVRAGARGRPRRRRRRRCRLFRHAGGLQQRYNRTVVRASREGQSKLRQRRGMPHPPRAPQHGAERWPPEPPPPQLRLPRGTCLPSAAAQRRAPPHSRLTTVVIASRPVAPRSPLPIEGAAPGAAPRKAPASGACCRPRPVD